MCVCEVVVVVVIVVVIVVVVVCVCVCVCLKMVNPGLQSSGFFSSISYYFVKTVAYYRVDTSRLEILDPSLICVSLWEAANKQAPEKGFKQNISQGKEREGA